MNKQAQFLSIDLAAALFVFVLLLLFLHNAWSANQVQWQQLRETTELEERAIQQARALVESPGYPVLWHAGDVNVIGLALHPNVLSAEKLAVFSAMDYNVAREKMNLLAFNFKIEIVFETHDLDQNMGIEPTDNQRVVSVERKVLLGGKNAVFRFKLFR